MGLLDIFKRKPASVAAAEQLPQIQTMITQAGTSALYAQFGADIYRSEVVNQCVKRIADEMKKLAPRHVIETGESITTMADDIAAILQRPNELMTISDFLEKITYKLFSDYNVFIYPTYINGINGRRYTGLYPLNPANVEFGQTERGRTVVKFTFNNGYETVLPYEDVIHWRYRYSVDDYMGGGQDGQPDNTALLDTLKLDKAVKNGMAKAANAPINGVVKYGSVISENKLQEAVARFNADLKNSESGVLALDMKSEFQPISHHTDIADANTLDYLRKEVAAHFGVSLPVLDGTATLDEKRAFYDTCIEPLIVSLNQCFTDTLLTPVRRNKGHRVIFYAGELQFMATADKINFVKEVGGRGVLTDNQILGMFGLPPYEGGDVRRVSLNYVDTDIANQYQLKDSNIGAKIIPATDGGTDNDETTI